MAHATMVKFGHPDSVIRDYAHWVLQLRPKQATLGSLVLIARSEATAFGDLSAPAFAELGTAVAEIETALGGLFAPEKMNYLMLMMMDPHVHFHVLPRYGAPRDFAGVSFADPGWPGPPDLGHAAAAEAATLAALGDALRAAFEGGPGEGAPGGGPG